MSRAGKFIPGGAGRKTGAIGTRTGPIRAPAETGTPEAAKSGRRLLHGGSLVRPVAKNQRLPIMLMSGGVYTALLAVALYYFAILPAKRAVLSAQQQTAAVQKQLAETQAAEKAREEAAAKAALVAHATVTVDSRPSGASVIIGESHQKTPASFTDVVPGKITVTIQAEGYRDYKQDLTVAADKPTDLGVIELVAQSGDLSLTSPDSDVTYTLTGPNSYSHQGAIPEKISDLAPGDYRLIVAQHDWKLPPETITIHDQDSIEKAIKFPSADASITSVPSGATIRNGQTVLGQTPLSLPHLRPGTMHLSADLAPYALQRFALVVPQSGTATKTLILRSDKSFIDASGLAMVWIPDGNFWAGKYEMRQKEFEAVAGYNPSTFRGPNRPVETISWDAATAFCAKLTQVESKAGKLPEGYHYALPTESQWSTFSADADINQAVMSRTESLSSTADVGSSEPNKYGIYDTLGNVWEWCQDLYDDKGNHSLRGGSWLSSPDNFPNADTRSAGSPKYADRFTGFRVVLVPN